ncbi:MAG TPA: DUF4167 domain-containing protein [Sphingomonas sp.]|nr:DUF4167 domain-containing protein [Sphingomonas sp.]
MINNRQNGRRRGRGGQQARNGQPGVPDRGNRLDNRARGNAAQLLEKYKTLARDAQMQGDRVNTEYYLQFADHYFRVLSENRARFEDQRPPRSNDNRDDFGGDEDGGDNQRTYQGRDDQNGDDGWDDGEQQAQPQAEQQRNYAPRPERSDRAERPERAPYQGEGNADGNREATSREGGRERGRRNGNNGGNANNGNGFAAPDFLNEPLTPRFEMERGPETDEVQQADGDSGQTEEAAPKRRRTRRPRGEAAPAEA